MRDDYEGGAGWAVQNNVLSDAHGAVVNVRGGDIADATPHRILGNRIFRGGKLGIQKANKGALIKGNKVYNNNTELFCYFALKDPATGVRSCNTKDGPKPVGQTPVGQTIIEAGGTKLGAYVDGVTVDSNEVYSNIGNGIWFDVYGTNTTISNNRVHHNGRAGISYEISKGGKIFGNAVWENGWKVCNQAPGSGIVLQSSHETEVYSNTLAWNAEGIAVVSADREDTEYDKVHDVSVRGNTVAGENVSGTRNHVALGWYQTPSGTLYQSANNNRGANNKYWYTTAEGTYERFRWTSPLKLLSQFNATLGEEGGRYLTNTQKNTALSSKGIPTTPPISAANRPVTESCPAQ
jgi:parallel beta-helix repeat protein